MNLLFHMAHHCHATNCRTVTQPELFMCKMHWYRLPSTMRALIWKTYRNGQCDDMNPSREYCIIAKRCVEFIAELEGIEPDVKLYDLFLRK